MIRVLVAEASDSGRALTVETLRHDKSIDVIGEARDGLEAIAMTHRLKPELVILDLQMPKADGFLAIDEIMTTSPVPIVAISSKNDPLGTNRAAHALSSGALTVLSKLEGTAFGRNSHELIATVRAMAEVKVVRRHSRPRSALVLPPRTHFERPRPRRIYFHLVQQFPYSGRSNRTPARQLG